MNEWNVDNYYLLLFSTDPQSSGMWSICSRMLQVFLLYTYPAPTCSCPENHQILKAWFGSYGILGKFCLKPSHCAVFFTKPQPACLGFSWCFTQEPKRRSSLEILSGLCFRKEKPCWIANVILNSLDVRAELTESHCLCLKQIFIM